MRLRTLWIPITLLSLAGCGDDGVELEKGPFLKVDRLRMEFDTEFGSGTYVGATGFNSLYIENGGDAPLEITKITKSGSGAFTLRLPEDVTLPYRLESLKRTFVEVRFTPPEAKTYEGKLVIESNAGNAPMQEVALAGRGIPPP
jgi:hypothetical protein